MPLTFTDAANSTVWQFTLPGITGYPNPSAARQAIQADLATAQHDVAIDWPTQLKTVQLFFLACLRPGTNIIARGSDIDSSIASFPNTQIWRSDSFSNMGIVGIDQQILWVYTNPNAQSPVFRIALPTTVNLLYTFLQLLPVDSGASVAQKLQKNQAPFGSCEICSQPLWPQNRYSRPRISCVNHPQQGRNMNRQDATQYAQFMGRTCEACGAALKGLQNGATGQVFLAYSHTSCNWRTSLNQLI